MWRARHYPRWQASPGGRQKDLWLVRGAAVPFDLSVSVYVPFRVFSTSLLVLLSIWNI